MTKLYKLTDYLGRTRAGEDNELTWAVGVEHKTAGTGTRLCTADVIHAYEHPLIAVLMNPVHADLNPAKMRLFVAEGEIVAREVQLKCGVHALKIVEEITVPTLTTEQRIKFAILCAKLVCKDAAWNAWADKWLSGEDRSEAAAAAARAAEAAAALSAVTRPPCSRAAARAAAAAARAMAWAAAAAARAMAWAAEAAEAEAATRAAEAAEAEAATRAAEAAEAEAAEWAAEAAAEAAEWAARETATELDLIHIIEQI